MTSNHPATALQRSFWSEVDPFRDFFQSPLRAGVLQNSLRRRRESGWSPAVNLSEDEDAYLVTVELAGVEKDDVGIESHDNVLTIKGEKRDEGEETAKHRHYVERSFGQFTRSFRLPTDASDDVVANLKDGVLTVRVKKHEEEKPKVVAINS